MFRTVLKKDMSFKRGGKKKKERNKQPNRNQKQTRDFSRALQGGPFTARFPPVSAHRHWDLAATESQQQSFSGAANNNSIHHQHLFHPDSKVLGQQIWLGTGESLPDPVAPQSPPREVWGLPSPILCLQHPWGCLWGRQSTSRNLPQTHPTSRNLPSSTAQLLAGCSPGEPSCHPHIPSRALTSAGAPGHPLTPPSSPFSLLSCSPSHSRHKGAFGTPALKDTHVLQQPHSLAHFPPTSFKWFQVQRPKSLDFSKEGTEQNVQVKEFRI